MIFCFFSLFASHSVFLLFMAIHFIDLRGEAQRGEARDEVMKFYNCYILESNTDEFNLIVVETGECNRVGLSDMWIENNDIFFPLRKKIELKYIFSERNCDVYFPWSMLMHKIHYTSMA